MDTYITVAATVGLVSFIIVVGEKIYAVTEKIRMERLEAEKWFESFGTEKEISKTITKAKAKKRVPAKKVSRRKLQPVHKTKGLDKRASSVHNVRQQKANRTDAKRPLRKPTSKRSKV